MCVHGKLGGFLIILLFFQNQIRFEEGKYPLRNFGAVHISKIRCHMVPAWHQNTTRIRCQGGGLWHILSPPIGAILNQLGTKMPLVFGAQDMGFGTFSPSLIGAVWNQLGTKIPCPIWDLPGTCLESNWNFLNGTILTLCWHQNIYGTSLTLVWHQNTSSHIAPPWHLFGTKL